MSQLSDYSAPSMDGFNAFNSLYTHASVPKDDLKKSDPEYYKKLYKVSNNKFPDCPAIMDDGRAFTDYRSSCFINSLIKSENKIRNSYDYRQYLINNGKKIMNDIRLYNINKSSCRECEPRPINCHNVCKVDRESVNCSLKNECGYGTCYKAVPLPASNYVNKLSKTKLLKQFQ